MDLKNPLFTPSVRGVATSTDTQGPRMAEDAHGGSHLPRQPAFCDIFPSWGLNPPRCGFPPYLLGCQHVAATQRPQAGHGGRADGGGRLARMPLQVGGQDVLHHGFEVLMELPGIQQRGHQGRAETEGDPWGQRGTQQNQAALAGLPRLHVQKQQSQTPGFSTQPWADAERTLLSASARHATRAPDGERSHSRAESRRLQPAHDVCAAGPTSYLLSSNLPAPPPPRSGSPRVPGARGPAHTGRLTPGSRWCPWA